MTTEKELAGFISNLVIIHKEYSKENKFAVRDPIELFPVKKDLEDYILKNAGHGNNPIPSLIRWWDANKKKDPETHGRCHTLLGFIDNHYKNETPRILRGDSYDVLVGRRFWDDLKRKSSEIPKTTYNFFPRIRVLEKDQAVMHYPPEDENPYGPKPLHEWTEFRVGLCAFSGKAHTKFKGSRIIQEPDEAIGKNGIYGFVAETIEPENEYKKELSRVVQWVKKERINLLLMPELSVCGKGRNILIEEIENEKTDLYLIMPGSYHCRLNKKMKFYVNQAPVWWNTPLHSGQGSIQESGEMYTKMEPFHIAASEIKRPMPQLCKIAVAAGCLSVQEDIYLGTKFHLFLTPLGIFGILICKDVFTEDYFVKYRQLADHLCIISMNSAPDYFSAKATECSMHGTSCFYVNASQITNNVKTPVETAIWTIPHQKKGYNHCYYNISIDKENDRYTNKRIPENGLVLVVGFPIKPSMRC